MMFGVGPMYLFVLQHRLPVGLMRSSWHFWLSTMATNLAIAVLAATMIWLVGLGPFLLVQLPITLLAGSIGVWLFDIQHQFEDTFWARDEGWNFHEAALHGSSHYDLPNVLRWFTANIGVHHVHHLCSRIPYYRLPRVFRDHPELAAVGRLTLLESLHCVRMVLWDESRRRHISFREMHILTTVMTKRTAAVPNRRSHRELGRDAKKEDRNDVDDCIDRRVDHATRDDFVVDTAMRRHRHSEWKDRTEDEPALMTFEDEAASSPSRRSNVGLGSRLLRHDCPSEYDSHFYRRGRPAFQHESYLVGRCLPKAGAT